MLQNELNGLISLEEYAKSKGLSNVSLFRQARKGNIKSAQKIGKKWYAHKSELDAKYYEYSVIPSNDYVTLKEYSQIYELEYKNLLSDVRKGKYQTAIKNGKNWYLDRKEIPYFAKWIKNLIYHSIIVLLRDYGG